MPIYSFNCKSCERNVDVFVRNRAKVSEAKCPACDSQDLRQLVARVARVRSANQRLDEIDVSAELGALEGKDQGAFAKWARKMGNRFDGELGSDFSELADKADAGEDPVERFDAEHTLRYRIGKARDENNADSVDDYSI